MRVLPLLLLTALAVSGCSVLPASGPTARAVEAGAELSTPEGLLARYELVDVTPAVIEALRGR
ncbi:sugar transporter, partial [Methylobacterium sp. WL30]